MVKFILHTKYIARCYKQSYCAIADVIVYNI